MLSPDPSKPLEPRLMTEATRSRYTRLHKVVSLCSLIAFLGFLLVPIQYRQVSYALLGAALVLLAVAGALKALLIKGTPLKNDLEKIREEATSDAANRPGREAARH